MATKRFRATMLLLAGALAVAWGQLPAPQGAVPRKLVNLNVVALDNHDQPVVDLTAEDLQVTDAGKSEPVVFFRHNDERLQAQASLAQGEFSNRIGVKQSHPIVILFDRFNDSLGPSGAAMNELGKALEKMESGGGDLYLYFLTKQFRLYPVRALPGGDSADAKPLPDTWTRQAHTLLDAANAATFSLRAPGFTEGDVIVKTYDAIEGLARQMAGLPGRKNLVWITHGVPLTVMDIGGQPFDFTPYLRRLCAGLDRANVALYPVQQTPPGMAMSGTPEAQHSGMSSAETLGLFAELTGGRSNGGGDIGAVLRQAEKDVRTSYQIAYEPAESNWDGKFHKLKVTTKRKGVKLQSKTGYYAWAGQPADEQDAVGAVVGSPSDSAQIGMNVTATRLAKDPQIVHLKARIDAGDVALLLEGGQYTGAVGVTVAAYNDQGQAQAAKVAPLDLKFTAAQRDEVLKNGIPYEKDVRLGAPVKKVRLLVLDMRLGTAGSVTMPVEEIK
jgi:VWFA-related protein